MVFWQEGNGLVLPNPDGMSRNVGWIVLAALGAAMGCRGEKRARLDEMVPVVTAQISETLLGVPARSLTSGQEPPILGVEGRERVVLAADEAAFVETIGEEAKVGDVRRVVERISNELDRSLKRRSRRLSSVAGAFPPTSSDTDAVRTVLASVTPYVLQTGGPETSAKKRESLLMVRLTLTEARTGRSLAVREFFTGYTLSSSRASR